MAWKLSQISDKIRRDLNLNSERFVTPEEIRTYINSAIEDAEQIINDQGSDYFLTVKSYTTASGDSELDMPDNIYHGRLRYLYFDDDPSSNINSEVYRVKRIDFSEIPRIQSGDRYRYRLINDSTNGFKIKIYPDIEETGTGYFKAYYIRKAKTLVDDGDECDIPKIEYIFSHAKLQCMAKDPTHPLLDFELKRYERQETSLMKAFNTLTDDGEDIKLEPSSETLSDFQDFSDSFMG